MLFTGAATRYVEKPTSDTVVEGMGFSRIGVWAAPDYAELGNRIVTFVSNHASRVVTT